MTVDFEKKEFPPTRPSAVAGVASDDAAERARAFDLLVRAYWRPVYTYVRLRWRKPPEDARDVVQAFFARAFEKKQLGGYEPGRVRFRTYLRAALDHFVADEARAASRQKRGGGAPALALDFDDAEQALAKVPVDAENAEQLFDREWTRSLFDAGIAALQARCEKLGKQVHFEVFRRYVLEPETKTLEVDRPSYAEVAKACGIAVTDVTNYLSWARKELRTCVLVRLREITHDEEEFREEARAVLGADP
ncbi:MAG: sigma-70 family RNA polymerase sigma factor [Deltaproteobacteria bacterium]|nr:sigma-70 family RNA polymerase sigma factor [Deltaproteobacteria bacterium]